MLPDSILPTPEDDIARILRDYEKRLSHLETLEGGGGGFEIGARVFNNANISIPNAANTTLTFNSERFDTDSIHNVGVNPSRLTANTAGKYIIKAQVEWARVAGLGFRQMVLVLNGITNIGAERWHPPANELVWNNISTTYELSVTDYVEIVVHQTSGGPLDSFAGPNIAPEFMMQKIG